MCLTHSSQGAAVDILHDVLVRDPYRWLENRRLPATDMWIAEQMRRSEGYFADLPCIDILRSIGKKYLDVEWRDQPARIGGTLFYRYRKQHQEQASICMKREAGGSEQTLVDPASIGPSASVAIHCISPDGALLAYEVRCAGSDATAMHIVDTLSGRTLVDCLPTGRARGLAFTKDNNGFYYCHETGESSAHHVIRLHRLGSSSEQDVSLFSVPMTSRSRLILISDNVNICALYTHDYRENSDGLGIDLYLAKRMTPSQWSPLSQNNAPPYVPYLNRGRIFILTEDRAPNRRISEIFEDGSPEKELVPESKSLIQEVVTVGDKMYVSYLVDRNTEVHEWTLDGIYLGLIGKPVNGSMTLLSGPQGDSTVFYCLETHVRAPQIFEYSADSARSHTAFETLPGSEPPFDCYARDVTYRSSDGATIPMLLMMRSDVDSSRPNPVILTSYGGFGISATPKFSVMLVMLLELGVIVAMPGIRGGSELGKAWHEAAKGKNRQTSFNDFIAAAEWLVAERWTNPEKLGIYGASNSGLLVAVALTQRPDLFRAVVCMGPLLDMIRYEQFDGAHRWRSEFGSVDNPEEFRALLSYSPYHHVGDEINYPPVLFVSGDSDDRCNPAHVRKMVALLQNRDSQKNQILVDYSRDRGHHPGLPTTARIEAIARRTAFVIREMGLSIPQET